MSGSPLPEVVDPLLASEQRDLLARFAREMAPHTTTVHVRPMARFGYSTAKLCLVHFDEARAGRPFVVKVDEADEIVVEKTAIAELLVFFADADVHCFIHKDYGAIAYPLQEASTGEIETFEDALRAPHASEGRLKGALERVYARCCGIAHGAKTVERRNLGDEYSRHHKSGATDKMLAIALGSSYTDDPFDYYGAKIIDPRAVKTVLDATELTMTISPIHGDLHGSNIVFDPDDHPHLIDFAWGDRAGHLMKDFVLMETSLRFFAFPRYFDAATHARVDAALLAESGYQEISNLAAGSPLEADYKQLASLIGVVRGAARAAAGDEFFSEYLPAQFMMMYRLVQYPTYPFQPTLRCLGELGLHIVDKR